jgi:hypothetical protein
MNIRYLITMAMTGVASIRFVNTVFTRLTLFYCLAVLLFFVGSPAAEAQCIDVRSNPEYCISVQYSNSRFEFLWAIGNDRRANVPTVKEASDNFLRDCTAGNCVNVDHPVGLTSDSTASVQLMGSINVPFQYDAIVEAFTDSLNASNPLMTTRETMRCAGPRCGITLYYTWVEVPVWVKIEMWRRDDSNNMYTIQAGDLYIHFTQPPNRNNTCAFVGFFTGLIDIPGEGKAAINLLCALGSNGLTQAEELKFEKMFGSFP